MPAVVTVSSIVTCGHAGTVATTGSPKLTVGGSPALVAAGIAGKPVAHCTTPTVTGPPPSKPCLLVVTVNPASLSTKLLVSGNPVVLATLQGTTDGEVGGVTPQPLLSAAVTQTLLSAI
jgi:hypothetical protein